MTTQNVYASRSDLYKFGFPRGKLTNPGLMCGSVLASTDTFELDGHGLSADDPFIVRAEAGGTLPAPLVAGVTYYAIPLNDQTFKAAAAPQGAPIDLTTDGDAVVVAMPLPFDDVLEFYSRFVDGNLPAHLVPLQPPYPKIVVAIVAELAAKKLLNFEGQMSASMTEDELGAKAQVERWAAGFSLRDGQSTGPSDLAYSESVASPRGWGSGGGVLL